MAEERIGGAYVEIYTKGSAQPGLEEAQRQAQDAQARLKQAMAGTAVLPAGAGSAVAPAASLWGAGAAAAQTQAAARAKSFAVPTAVTGPAISASAIQAQINQMNAQLGNVVAAGTGATAAAAAKAAVAPVTAEAHQYGLRSAFILRRLLSGGPVGISGSLAGGLIGSAAGNAMFGAMAGNIAFQMAHHGIRTAFNAAGLASPADAQREERAQADLKASFGGGFRDAYRSYIADVRKTADVFAANKDQINRATKVLYEGAAGPFGLLLDWASKGKEGKSVGAAPDPSLGRFSSPDDYYREVASHMLKESPPNWFGKETETARDDNTDALKDLTTALRGLSTVGMPGQIPTADELAASRRTMANVAGAAFFGPAAIAADWLFGGGRPSIPPPPP